MVTGKRLVDEDLSSVSLLLSLLLEGHQAGDYWFLDRTRPDSSPIEVLPVSDPTCAASPLWGRPRNLARLPPTAKLMDGGGAMPLPNR